MNLTAALAALGLALVAGCWLGIEWEQGRAALALKEARVELDAQTRDMNEIALKHAELSAKINRQLGDARVRLRDLTTGRDCLSADAVRMLNTNGRDVPAAPAGAASAPTAAATDRDVGDALAICRSGYGQLSDQLNSILDIEDTKH